MLIFWSNKHCNCACILNMSAWRFVYSAVKSAMSESKYNSFASQIPSADSRGVGPQMISRRKMDARKLFEESLQKVTRTSRKGVESSELMHLLLTPGPVCASDGPSARASDDAVQDVDLDTKNNVASCSSTGTSTDEVLDLPASVAADRTSVFTSEKLDEYLAKDRIQDASAEVGENDRVHAPSVQDLDVKWNSSTDRQTGKQQDSVSVAVSLSSGKDEPIQSVDSSYVIASERSDRQTSEVEVDIIDGFSFYSFSTPDALLQYIDDSSQTWRTGVDAGGSRTKKFQYGIAGNMAKYLAKMKGWEKRTSMACDERADALDALFSDGMVRQLSDTAVLGLNLTSTADDVDTLTSANDGGRAAVGQYQRRGVGKMGDEERQPRKGRIYGRKFDGRFASKANIHYHIKRRRSPTAPQAAVVKAKTEPCSQPISSSGYSGISEDSSQSVTIQQNISRFLSPNLQPRVDLTKAIIRPKTKDDDRLSSKLKASSKNKIVPKSTNQVHLIRLTEAAARRAILALQLSPSMTNSPMKCIKPSMIQYIHVA